MRGQTLRIGSWEFRDSANELARDDRCIKLESRCALVLQYLCEHAGEVVTHSDLLDAVWGRQAVSVQSIPVVISKLRALLGDDIRQPRYIETIPKRGYRLIAEVDRSPGDGKPGTDQPDQPRRFKPVLHLTSGALLILGLVFLSGILQSSRQTPRVLYVADVANLTNDGDMNAVAAGASEVLSSELARAGGLPVVRLRRGRGEDQWVAPGLRDDGARPAPLVTTSVVLTEQGTGIVMQLEDGADRRVVWTHAFDVSGGIYAAGQREAAHRLLEYFSIAGDPGAAAYASGTLGVEEIYLRAKYLWSLRGRENNVLAADLARQVLELDPDYVPALALLAEIYAKYTGGYLNLGAVDTAELARRHLEHAVRLDPDHLSVLLARTRQLILLDRRPDLALSVADRAIELAPGDSMAHRIRASTLYILGRIDESLTEIDRAIGLELGSPYVEVEYIMALYLGARHAEVVKVAEEIGPEFLGTFRAFVAASYYQLGRHREAMQTWLDALDVYGVEVDIRENLLRLAGSGQVREAYATLIDYTRAQAGGEDYRVRFPILHLFWSIYSGGEDEAMELLATMPVNRNARYLLWLHRVPLFDRFRDNPTFKDFLARIGVAQYAECVHPACYSY